MRSLRNKAHATSRLRAPWATSMATRVSCGVSRTRWASGAAGRPPQARSSSATLADHRLAPAASNMSLARLSAARASRRWPARRSPAPSTSQARALSSRAAPLSAASARRRSSALAVPSSVRQRTAAS